MADKREESSPVEHLDFWMTYAVRNPTQHDRVAQEVSKLMKNVGACRTSVQIVLDFYRHLQPLAFNSVVGRLVDLETIMDISQPALNPFMCQLLFERVTKSSTECVQYCVQIWLERIQSQKSTQHLEFSDLPNPLEFLDPQSPTRQSAFPSSLLLQFQSFNSKERQAFIKQFRVLFDCIPATFYSRTSIAFYIFLEFYKHNSCENDDNLLEEVVLWMETCVLLIADGLMKASPEGSKSLVNGLPLQHTLSVLLISTKALIFLKVHSDIQKKLAKALERLQSCTSGVTWKWLQILRSGIETPNEND